MRLTPRQGKDREGALEPRAKRCLHQECQLSAYLCPRSGGLLRGGRLFWPDSLGVRMLPTPSRGRGRGCGFAPSHLPDP